MAKLATLQVLDHRRELLRALIVQDLEKPLRLISGECFFFFLCAEGCDPDCLLQGPETSKVPKAVRRGCKRSFGPKAPKSSCTGAKESCSGAKQDLGGAKDVQTLLLTTLGAFEVSGPCNRHSGSQAEGSTLLLSQGIAHKSGSFQKHARACMRTLAKPGERTFM